MKEQNKIKQRGCVALRELRMRGRVFKKIGRTFYPHYDAVRIFAVFRSQHEVAPIKMLRIWVVENTEERRRWALALANDPYFEGWAIDPWTGRRNQQLVEHLTGRPADELLLLLDPGE